jgi:hypothetical protein
MSALVEVRPVAVWQSALSIANRSKRSTGIIMHRKLVEVSRSQIARLPRKTARAGGLLASF